MNFGDTYKKLSTVKLLDILANKQDYKPEAIEAAELELKSRTDIDSASAELQEKNEALLEKEKRKQKNTSERIMDDPDPQAEKRIDRFINIICVVLLLYCLYSSFMSSELLMTILSEIGDVDLYGIWFLAEFFYLPISLYFFWKRRKNGWTMLLIWLTYRCILILYRIYSFASFLASDSFFYRDSMQWLILFVFLLYLIFYGGIIYFISRPNTRTRFFGGKIERDLDVLDDV